MIFVMILIGRTPGIHWCHFHIDTIKNDDFLTTLKWRMGSLKWRSVQIWPRPQADRSFFRFAPAGLHSPDCAGKINFLLPKSTECILQGNSPATPVKEMPPGTPWWGQDPPLPHRIWWLSIFERVGIPLKSQKCPGFPHFSSDLCGNDAYWFLMFRRCNYHQERHNSDHNEENSMKNRTI